MNSSSGYISFNCNGSNTPTTITITQGGGFNVIPGSSYTIDGGNVITLSGLDTYRILNVQAGGAVDVAAPYYVPFNGVRQIYLPLILH